MNNGQHRMVRGLDADSVAVIGAQIHAWLKAQDPLGLYLRSSSGHAQMRFRKALSDGVAKVALIGDSWGVLPNFGQGIKDRLCGLGGDGKYSQAEYGWVTTYATTVGGVTSFTGLDEVKVTYSGGWKAGVQPGADYDRLRRHETYDWGPDGYWCSATGTSGTVTIADVAGTETAPAFDTLYDYCYDGPGAWAYRILVDGVVKATVTTTNTNSWRRIEVGDLGDTGHVVTFDLSGNAGTVVRYGCYLARSAGTGVAYSNMGHAGARIYAWGGQRLNPGIGILQPGGENGDGQNFAWEILQSLGFDTVLVLSGTNDARTGGGMGYFTYGLTQTVARIKAMASDTGVILMPSPQTYDSGTREMSERSVAEKMYRVATEVYAPSDEDIGVDLWNLFGAVPSYAIANAAGYYEDETAGNGNHVTPGGGQAIGRAFAQSGML